MSLVLLEYMQDKSKKMVDFEVRLENILEKLKPSFEILSGSSSVKVVVVKKADYLMAVNTLRKVIMVDYFMRKATDEAITGAFVHELVHLTDDTKNLWSWGSSLVMTKKRRTKNERLTDLKVIEMGYGIHLLEFQKFHDKHFEKYNQNDGLTKKEIKMHLKDLKIS